MQELARRSRAATPWIPVAIYAALILGLSSIPARSMPQSQLWRFDKVVHACEYAVLAFLLVRALRLGPPRLGTALAIAVGVLAAAAFGATDEFYQTFTGRNGSPMDWLADATGAVIGALVATAWLGRKHGHHSRI